MLSYIKSIRAYEIIAFTTGFALLAYELAAARILAPSIGSSTYVWTSVIGVIIAALSAGYAIGGIIADKRVAPQDIAWLLLASALGVSLTLVFADGTLSSIQGLSDARIQGLLASLLLFAPASFALGMISPYLARLRTPSLGTTGRSVASLSAMNAIGGIIGTFCVGFIFFSYIGANETLIVVIVLLIASSWLIKPSHRTNKRIIATLLILTAVSLQLAPAAKAGVIADINTPSARYQVVEGNYLGAPVRILTTGPRGSQSGVYTNGSTDLVFDYTRLMADLVDRAPHRKNILILGGGAMTLPAYLADRHGDSEIDVIEIDPQLEQIAKQYFNFHDRPNVNIIAQDARAYLNSTHKQYDLILVDVYADTSIPFSVATVEYTQALKNALTTQGSVIVNAIGANTTACGPLLSSIHTSYLTNFQQYQVQPLRDPALQTMQNLIISYSNNDLQWAGHNNTPLPSAQPLTDNFAPIENLQQQCWDGRS